MTLGEGGLRSCCCFFDSSSLRFLSSSAFFASSAFLLSSAAFRLASSAFLLSSSAFFFSSSILFLFSSSIFFFSSTFLFSSSATFFRIVLISSWVSSSSSSSCIAARRWAMVSGRDDTLGLTVGCFVGRAFSSSLFCLTSINISMGTSSLSGVGLVGMAMVDVKGVARCSTAFLIGTTVSVGCCSSTEMDSSE